jgi:hypothetical protein
LSAAGRGLRIAFALANGPLGAALPGATSLDRARQAFLQDLPSVADRPARSRTRDCTVGFPRKFTADRRHRKFTAKTRRRLHACAAIRQKADEIALNIKHLRKLLTAGGG